MKIYINSFRCGILSLLNCHIRYRANNLAVVRIDFADKYFVQKNIVDRMPLNNRIAGYGGTIGNFYFYQMKQIHIWLSKTSN